MNNQTRRLSEGAMMVAMLGIMLFVNRQFANMIEFFMYWVLTFPILIYTAKYGMKYGALTALCMMLLSFMISSFTTIFYLFCCVITGLIYGEGVRRRWKNGWLLLLTGLFTFISYVITTIVLASVFGYDPKEDVELVRMLLQFVNISSSSVNMQYLVPAIVVMSAVLMSVLQTICIHLLAHILMQRLKIEAREMTSLFDLHVPKYMGIIIIIIWILFLARNVLKLNQEVSGILFIIFLCAFIFALAYGVLTCMMWSIAIHKRAFVFLIVIGVFIRYVQDLIAIVGILDMLFSLREQMKRGVIHG